MVVFRCYVAVMLMVGLITFPGVSAATQERRQDWQIGYWLWRMYGEPPAPAPGEVVVDFLYVQAGEFWSESEFLFRRHPWRALAGRGGGREEIYPPVVKLRQDVWWPENLPQAGAYVAVWRNTSVQSPGENLVPELLGQYQEIKRHAAQVGQHLVGLQIDHDAPTGALPEYARFLQALRKALPAQDLLSITALLDWFRPGTHIGEVLQWVNEYVPQFYDVEATHGSSDVAPIAAKIDPATWAPVFNAFGKPYRLGIGTFGRIVWVAKSSSAMSQRQYLRDFSPLDVASQRELVKVEERRNEAGETVLRYEVRQRMTIADSQIPVGDRIEVILPTPDSVRAGYAAVRALGGHCRGVVFFRWPQANEALVLTPVEVQTFLADEAQPARPPQLEIKDGECAVVGCADLYLRLRDRYPTRPVRLRIQSSSPLEYVLPAGRVRLQMQGLRTLEVKLPAYAGVPRIYLGRAVTRERAGFTVGVIP